MIQYKKDYLTNFDKHILKLNENKDKLIINIKAP